MTNAAPVDAAVAALSAARHVMLTTHVRPDGDAIGSTLGLWHMLTGRGQTADVVLLDDAPPRYHFLTEKAPTHRWGREYGPPQADRADLICIVDTSALNQLEPIAPYLSSAKTRKLVIDHHATRDRIGDVEYFDQTAGATSRMIVALCRAANWTIPPVAATPLFVGLATDTGWFHFSNAAAPEFDSAAQLIRAGARPDELYRRLYQSDPAPRLRLIGRLLSEMQLLADGRLAVLKLSRKLLAECGADDKMTEEIVNEPQRIASVVAVVLCAEGADGIIRVSFRSREPLDVAALAAQFGGGGHTRASGARIAGTLDDVTARVVTATLSALA